MQNNLKLTYISYFPEVTAQYFNHSFFKKLIESKKLFIETISIFKNTKNVDYKTYGGNEGIIMRFDVVHQILSEMQFDKKKTIIIHPAASGYSLNQEMVRDLSVYNNIIFLCSRYEGIDCRIVKFFSITEISIGPYILYDGDTSSIVISNAIIRNIYVKKKAHINESFDKNLLEHDQYTRPYSFCNMSVPKVLAEGDHKKIKEWKLNNSIQKTKSKNKELYNLYNKQNKDEKKSNR